MLRLNIFFFITVFFIFPAIADDIDIYLNNGCIGKSLVSPWTSINIDNETGTGDMFFPLFSPSGNERWPGNVKKLALRDIRHNGFFETLDVPNLALAESGSPYVTAVDNNGGIHPDALTFWTRPEFLPSLDGNTKNTDGKDGNIVTRGGAGQMMPQFIAGNIAYDNKPGSRQIYTENANANGLMVFDATDSNAAEFYPLFKLGHANRPAIDYFASIANLPASLALPEKQNAVSKMLMHYARGVDINAENYDYRTESGLARQWIMGDVIHSSPLVLDYGNIRGSGMSADTEKKGYTSVIFGSNDGMIHFVENVDMQGRESGLEKYAFMPRELFDLLPVLAANESHYVNPQGSNYHPYGMDGKITSLIFDDTGSAGNNSDVIDFNIPGVNDFAYIYAGMRRGGKSYYALDVTHPSEPPQYLGKINKDMPDFAELGLTFSNAVPVILRFNSNVTPALIFAGGYDVAKDDEWKPHAAGSFPDMKIQDKPPSGFFDNTHGTTPDSEGNAVYIVNAVTLELIWKASNKPQHGNTSNHYYQPDLQYAIPSTVQAMDSNGDGYTDRIYVGDVAGNVWRGDFPECDTSSCSDPDYRKEHWKLTRIAVLAEASPAGDTRFFHPPAVVFTYDALGAYDAVIIGSGDSENPLERTDKNRIYMIKDRNTRSGSPPSAILGLHDLVDVTRCVTGTEPDCPDSSLVMENGWRFDVSKSNVDVTSTGGEKVLSQAVVVDGQVLLTTYTPALPSSAQDCVHGIGMSNLYMFRLKNGRAVNNNKTRYIELAPGMVGDIKITDRAIILPAAVPMDFLMPETKGPQQTARHEIPVPESVRASSFPAEVANARYIYWRENDINDTQ